MSDKLTFGGYLADNSYYSQKLADKMSDNKKELLQLLESMDSPVSLADIRQAFNNEASDRTLSRWLNQLVDEGKLQASGQKRGRKYAVTSPATISTSTDTESLFSKTALPFIEHVRQPLIKRPPCTYNMEWLEQYQPNETFYLNSQQRERLTQQGKLIEGELPAGTYARQIFNRMLIDLSYNSARLEGNTYSLPDTEKLLLEGLEADNKLDEEKIMLLNHKEAIRFLVDGINRMEISVDNIRSLHYLLSDGLVLTGDAGQIRSDAVRISSTPYLPMEGKERLETQLNRITEKAGLIEHPFEQSFFLLVHISYLQAFIDVNKRTARLACNIPLVRNNLVPLSFNDIEKDDYASAMLVAYEINEVQPLAELYERSYLRSCQTYNVTAEAIGIDPLRVQHRQARRDVIADIVKQSLHGHAMETHIQQQLEKRIPNDQHEKFLADLHHDLENLAPFNIAGMGITHKELETWQNQKSAYKNT